MKIYNEKQKMLIASVFLRQGRFQYEIRAIALALVFVLVLAPQLSSKWSNLVEVGRGGGENIGLVKRAHRVPLTHGTKLTFRTGIWEIFDFGLGIFMSTDGGGDLVTHSLGHSLRC